MTTINEAAEAYEPKQTLNVSELPEVPLDCELHDGSGTDEQGKEFKYKFISVNGKEYRVPSVVLGEIKKIKKLRPDIKKFKVKRSGAGLQTRYEVEIVE